MKHIFTIFLLGFFVFGSAQQNRKLLRIKDKYDNKLKRLQDKCFGDHDIKGNPEKIKMLDAECESEESILETRRSAENDAELAKIKSRAQQKNSVSFARSAGSANATVTLPQYPTGLNGFRKEVAENFNTAVITGKNMLRTQISFVVEPDGSISDVDSDGSNIQLNREAEIAVYLAKHRWKPALENGVAVPYRFKLPMTFYFE